VPKKRPQNFFRSAVARQLFGPSDFDLFGLEQKQPLDFDCGPIIFWVQQQIFIFVSLNVKYE